MLRAPDQLVETGAPSHLSDTISQGKHKNMSRARVSFDPIRSDARNVAFHILMTLALALLHIAAYQGSYSRKHSRVNQQASDCKGAWARRQASDENRTRRGSSWHPEKEYNGSSFHVLRTGFVFYVWRLSTITGTGARTARLMLLSMLPRVRDGRREGMTERRKLPEGWASGCCLPHHSSNAERFSAFEE